MPYQGLKLLILLIKSYSLTIQMKAIEQYFSVVLFIILYKVVLTFPSEDEILKSDESTIMKAEQWVFVVLFVFQCFEK